MTHHAQNPILYFVAVYHGQCQRIAAYSTESAQQQAAALLGGLSDFYQTFPVDVDYSGFPAIQTQKLAALGGVQHRRCNDLSCTIRTSCPDCATSLVGGA